MFSCAQMTSSNPCELCTITPSILQLGTLRLRLVKGQVKECTMSKLQSLDTNPSLSLKPTLVIAVPASRALQMAEGPVKSDFAKGK